MKKILMTVFVLFFLVSTLNFVTAIEGDVSGGIGINLVVENPDYPSDDSDNENNPSNSRSNRDRDNNPITFENLAIQPINFEEARQVISIGQNNNPPEKKKSSAVSVLLISVILLLGIFLILLLASRTQEVVKSS